ncbi:NAD(P)-binding protein [Lophium mytilinum]|uniref:NAD(P)-binding protein n=1 Tax=Lophium mytilinum TaxID=390894 RepID=A0A6A6QFS2_9PEZI|nr:NAD(P)-binding protein [Lophium mytilinum]
MSDGKSNTESLTSSKLFDVSHVTAIVTGGGTGIGLMITQALVANGAKVYITSRRGDVLKQSDKQHDSGSGEIIPITSDVSDKKDILNLVEEISKKEPDGIQLLVNNAGIARDQNTQFSEAGEPDMSSPTAISEHFLKSTPESWEDTFRTNTTAIFYTSMAFLPLLAKGGKKTPGYTSSIINVTSISGAMKGSSGGQFAYGTSKAGATHLSRALAATFAKTGVRVNVIAPGLFPSEMTTGESGEDNKSVINKELSNPAGRPGKDTDMAATVLMLAGKGGVFYNEQIMYPDGGSTLVLPATN